MARKLACILTLALVSVFLAPTMGAGAQVVGTDVTYTTDADFDLGTLVSVNHDPPGNDQLQLDSPTEPFPFINIAASGRGTVVRVDTETGEVVGEYATAPEGRGLNPSRTTVDLFGNVWTANREEVGVIDGVPHGSAVKIGLLAGGTRVDATGAADLAGGFVAPPFGYNTCVDRDADGLIRTSSGLHDVLPWSDGTDGVGGPDGIVQDAEDECILVYQRLEDAEQARHVSVDADNNVWVGGFPFEQRMFHRLDGATGAVLDSFDARDFGCGGYGGLIDGNGVLWSIGGGPGEGDLLRYDPASGEGTCVNTFGGYGLGVDTNGYVWASLWESGIAKVAPDGVMEPGFPKFTLPPSTGTATAVRQQSPSAVEVSAGQAVAAQSTVTASTEVPAAALQPEQLPAFWAEPDGDSVNSTSPWTPGASISLTIEDASGVVFTDTATADAAGDFHFDLWERFDLQRGHTVTVSDAITTKIHTVWDLYVDGVDVSAETVFGRADAGTDVEVWVHDTPANVVVTADGSGNWIADFSGQTDLTYASNGAAQQADDDGDSTFVFWSAPTIVAAPDDDWVGAPNRGWTPGTTVTLTVDDGSGPAYSDTAIVQPDGSFNFNLWERFDLQRNHTVMVSDGEDTKVHVVRNYTVDGIDVAAETVFGRADPGTEVHVWTHDANADVTATADANGDWVADFTGLTDITYSTDGNSQQTDDDGDATWVFWASPSFQVQPNPDWIGSWNRWAPDTQLSLTIDDDTNPGNGTLYEESVSTDGAGHFWLDLGRLFDVEPGHYVSVSDGTTTKVHRVLELHITELDAAADIVRGTAAPNSDVDVHVPGPDNAWRYVTADGSGAWEADFATLSGSGDGTADIGPTSVVSAFQFDEERDVTVVDHFPPVFRVSPESDWLWGWNWARNADLDIRVEDPGTGILYQVAASTNAWGEIEIGHWDFDLLPGQIVIVSDGTTTKDHRILDLSGTAVDLTGDSVSGVARPGADIEVNVGDFMQGSTRWVTADVATGAWVADFSVVAGDQPAFDLDERSRIEVVELDDDGDGTSGSFGPPSQANRGVAVTPVDDHVWVANSGTGTVTRLDNDGDVLAVIETGDEPTGVAVDASGKVWVTNLRSDTAVRIDPAGGGGLGAVDLTVDLGEGAGPYNYSDMTGAVVVGSTSPQGFWTVIQDSGDEGFEWGRITWNSEAEGSEPAGAAIVVEARTADTEAGLGGAAFASVVNGELFSSFGRYIEVRVTLKASSGGVSPVLSDVRVQPALIEVDLDIKPGSHPNSINIGRTTGVVPVAVLGSADFDVGDIDVATLRFGPDLAPPAHDLGDPLTYLDHLQDVNGDGMIDLVSHYRIGDVGLAKGDTEACLVGATVSGVPIEGCDSVRTVGKVR